MVYEGDGSSAVVLKRHRTPHYHGDEVRVLFVVSALIILIAQSTGIDLPMTGAEAVGTAIMLVVAAGITNPTQTWIHWINAFIAIIGTLIFGTRAVEYYHTGLSLFTPSFTYTEALALLSLVALYFTTRTVRGVLQRKKLA